MSNPTTPDPRRFSIQVVRRLREAGFDALWAGGCVRDLLLGKTPKDYDVASNARPEQVRKLFARTVAVGESFGVIRVHGGPGCDVEVAAFRSDGEYSDGRRPDTVRFSSPQEDALRRDFTINGMFYDPLEDQVFDYVGGKEDLDKRVIRAIGAPRERFAEDKLRLLRGVRFAASLNFQLEPATKEATTEMADQIGVVSPERILMELRSMLTPPSRAAALDLLKECRLFEQVLPETRGLSQDPDRWQEALTLCGHWRHATSLALALAGLFTVADGQTSQDAVSVALERLRASNEDKDRAAWLASRREALMDARHGRLATLKRLFAHPGVGELFDLTEALERLWSDSAPNADFCRSLFNSMTSAEIDPPPVLTGRDLIEAGMTPGPMFKELLERVRDEQLDGAVFDKEGALELVHRWAGC